jgi:sensor histidine kinase YesM
LEQKRSEDDMKYFFKELLNAFLLGILVFLIYGVILYLAGNPWYQDEVLTFFVQNQLYSVTLYMVNLYVFKAYSGRFEGNFWTRANIGFGLFISVMASLVTVFFLRLFISVVYYEYSLESFFQKERLEDYSIPLVISFVASSGYYAVVYWKQKQQLKVNESRLIAGTASAQFDALKNQLDPHFLFNSLNVLASLIEENPVMAQKFTTSLSKVYRYVLEQKSKELVPLDEELKFARTYMSLIKMRFEDSIEVSIPDRASNPEFKVVPLSLQLLLENAVKHNQVTPAKYKETVSLTY